MILYVDITEFIDSRFTTGIQRVIKEFLLRVLSDDLILKVLYFDKLSKQYLLINHEELKLFLADIKTYNISKKKAINIYEKSQKQKIFFDLDSVWNTEQTRTNLYPKLKEHSFKIFNFIYDLTPVLLPNMAKSDTKNNFPSFLKAVYDFSDFIFFDSLSAKKDLLKYLKHKLNSTKQISTKVLHLGSDFSHKKTTLNTNTLDILNKKYILFVGTLEPRKKHKLVLDSFEKLHEKHKNLHLVFIGKVGWKSEKLLSYITSHTLYSKNLHHLKDIEDSLLEQFYKNAFIVTYLSEYEGYGLPVAESLRHSNITITSNNSSLKEVGNDFADYITQNNKTQLFNLLSLYLENETIYNNKKTFIKQNYKPQNWDMFYADVISSIK